MNKQFFKEAKETRKSFVKIASQYPVCNNLKLRTEIDSLLIMYDQALQMLSEQTKEHVNKQIVNNISNISLHFKRKLLIKFLQWFFDNESKFDDDITTENFVDIFLKHD